MAQCANALRRQARIRGAFPGRSRTHSLAHSLSRAYNRRAHARINYGAKVKYTPVYTLRAKDCCVFETRRARHAGQMFRARFIRDRSVRSVGCQGWAARSRQYNANCGFPCPTDRVHPGSLTFARDEPNAISWAAAAATLQIYYGCYSNILGF